MRTKIMAKPFAFAYLLASGVGVLLLLTLLLLGPAWAGAVSFDPMPSEPSAVAQSSAAYTIATLDTGQGREYRCLNDGFHFLSVLNFNGALSIRPHPGQDPNGWGSTWYAQPFQPGTELTGANLTRLVATSDGISLDANGMIAGSGDLGTWSLHLDFWRVAGKSQVRGQGVYDISLNRRLDSSTGDLNLGRVASNFLDEVPLVGGGTGDTGDMRAVNVRGAGADFTWLPDRDGNHFPTDRASYLDLDLVGQYNHVDTASQGFAAIQPAYKPGLELAYRDHSGQASMTFGAIYDQSYNPQYRTYNSKLFLLDNVGVTPLVPVGTNRTRFELGLEFLSTPPLDLGAR